MAFVGPPPHGDKSIANHLNGNKLDNRVDNLEWTTYSGNITHAYKTGLRSEAQIVEAMNVETREVVEFYSLGEAARFLGVSTSGVFYSIEKWKMRPYHGHFLRWKDSGVEWPAPGTVFPKKPVDGTSFVMKHIETGKVSLHQSMAYVGQMILGCTSSSILLQMRKPKPEPYKGYLIREAMDPLAVQWMKDYPNYTDDDVMGLVLIDVGTGERKEFSRLSTVADFLGKFPLTITKHLRHGRNPFCGYGVYRADDPRIMDTCIPKASIQVDQTCDALV